MITLTKNAAEQINKLTAGKEQALRIKVAGGGCSGLSYKMDIVEMSSFTDKDKLFTSNEYGGMLIVDKKSFLYLNGSEVDYVNGLMRSEFKINNPNIEHSCGCGESFSVAANTIDKKNERSKELKQFFNDLDLKL
jgi:iron-sulfur cluster assembly accessory protein